jgi:hypothetical protein
MVYPTTFFHLAGILNIPVVLKVIQLARELIFIHGTLFALQSGVPLLVLVVQSSTLIRNECVSLVLL